MVFIAMSIDSGELDPKSEYEFPIIGCFGEKKRAQLIFLGFAAPRVKRNIPFYIRISFMDNYTSNASKFILMD